MRLLFHAEILFLRVFPVFLVSLGVAASPSLADSRKNPDLAREVLIPAGEFLMGTEDGTESERPVHKVWVDAFYLDRYEVSNKEFETLRSGYTRSRHSSCDNCPVTRVNWFEADAYCKRLGKRLPTESEWEKAARGPKGWNYSFAATPDPSRGHFGRPMPTGALPVDSLEPNGYGLYHMSGNVWEWVNDWFDGAYYHRSPKKNPTGPEKGFRKVVRGGSWYNKAYYLHTGIRFRLYGKTRLASVGFRCARNS